VTLSTDAAGTCPRCSAATATEWAGEPWCPSCEWNLARFDPEASRRAFGWGWLDRLLHRVAYRLTERQFAALADGPLTRRSMTVARAATLAFSVVLLAGVLAIAATGVWLVFHDFFGLFTVLGVVLIGVAWVLRPRVGRLGWYTESAEVLDRGAAPTLFAVVERVAVAVGSPMPDVVLLGDDFNAYTTVVGLRRRRVLCLGAVLWATLDEQERVALLGHELGHFVNGDLRRGLLTQVADSTLANVADLLSPDDDVTAGGGFLDLIAALVTRVVLGVLSRLVYILHFLLVSISLRDSQRAEYLADELGAKAGGTAAAIRINDKFLIDEAIDTVVRREARNGNGAAAWRTAAATARTNLAPDIPALRQLSRRNEVSVFASHPPSGLRAAMHERRPALPAAVVLTEPESFRIDEELAALYEQVRRELAYGY
jgi:heat shock protein HtpX